MTSPESRYHGYRFPPAIISHAVWTYHRFALSFRDVEDLLAQRGITVTYETIRQGCRNFGPAYARTLRRRRGRIRGISTSSSHCKGAAGICGAPSMRTATCSTSSCNRDGIGEQPSDSSGSY